MVSINESTVLVTGGQRGLGKAFVEAALELGAAKVYATARRPGPSADPRVVPLALEVTDPSSVAALADQARDVSIVINNAGAPLRKRLISTPPAHLNDEPPERDWERRRRPRICAWHSAWAHWSSRW